MATVEVKDIPMWLREGLDEEATDGVLNKRSEPRHGWLVLTRARLLSSPDTELSSVKTYNISRSGLGLITRIELDEGDELELSPMDDTGEPVHVRVVYCKQTIQGYKVGCEFVTD
ncbi:MAG: PilZ domain-containing protein [Planctomycetes bacterium]|nr:PilZ domain-containing protein [Planctomycetota bacterium]